MKYALITGITGQDGYYLSRLLLEKNYNVWGIIRRSSQINTTRLDDIIDKLTLKYGDVIDVSSISNIINEILGENPEVLEIYNLAAQSHVKISFEIPLYTSQVDALGTLNILECIRNSPMKNKIKFYQASSSEMFGKVIEIPQKETTPFNPQSPYAISKVYSYYMTKNYREAYDIFACNGILFNHESPQRGFNFVTKKITLGINKILQNDRECLYLGNLDAKRDWGHAEDYVRAMWMMLQYYTPDDYVVATGIQYSVRDFVDISFKYKDIHIEWKGEGMDEVGYDKKTGRVLVRVDKKYFRPCEVDTLLGDSSKIKDLLGWCPNYNFDELVKDMIDNN